MSRFKEILKENLWEELHEYLDAPEFELILKQQQKDIGAGYKVYPAPTDICNVYKTRPEDVKVVILGQDPYHNGTAIGLAFATNQIVPPSLRNIYKEVCDQFNHNVSMDDFDFTLAHWVDQGVFLLNTSLTVRQSSPGSYLGMWDFLVKPTIELINVRSPKAVFMLWGKPAQSYGWLVDQEKHTILKASHPAAEAYRMNAGFFGCGHFLKANDILETKIDWIG